MSSTALSLDDDCIFCKIIKVGHLVTAFEGVIPCVKLTENSHVLSFLDINPLSKGHALVIPKFHAQKTHELPDEYLQEILPVLAKVARAIGADNYNVLQNNGALAHQEVMHVHYHLIPKTTSEDGLTVRWPAKPVPPERLISLATSIKEKL